MSRLSLSCKWKVIRDFFVLFLLIQVPRFITWLLMIVSSWLCKVHNCVSITARFQLRAWKRENIYEEAPVFYLFFALTKKKKKRELKPINKQIPKQKLHSVSIVTEFFNSCAIYTFFIIGLSGFLCFTQYGSSSYCLNFNQLWDTHASPPPSPILCYKRTK